MNSISGMLEISVRKLVTYRTIMLLSLQLDYQFIIYANLFKIIQLVYFDRNAQVLNKIY